MLGAADRIRGAMGAKGRHVDVEACAAAIASLTDVLGTDTLGHLRAEGRALSGDDAIALALAETDFLETQAPPDV
jgi:hypothetical protein